MDCAWAGASRRGRRERSDAIQAGGPIAAVPIPDYRGALVPCPDTRLPVATLTAEIAGAWGVGDSRPGV